MSPATLRYHFPGRERRGRIFRLALPIMGGMMSQNVLNLVDTGMVGTLGDAALAATGLGSFLNFLCMSFILGLSVGVQAMAARRLGEDRLSETAVPLNGGLLLALSMGLPLAALMISVAPDLFAALNNDPAVVAAGTPYLQVRLAAMAGVGMNFAFRGYWSAVHQTRLYFGTLVFMHSLNIFLNWVFIFGHLGAPALGVTGAGLATTLSIYTGTATYVLLGLRFARDNGFMGGIPKRSTFATMLQVSLPSGLQQLFFSGGMVALFWIVGQIGTAQLAAANVLIHVMLVGVLPILGLGIAAASLVGNALGREDVGDANLWAWNVALLGVVLALAVGVPVALFPNAILSVFIHDPDTLAIAHWPLVITALMIWNDALGMVLFHAHLGAGDSRRVMMVSIGYQWLFFLPLAYLTGPVLGFGLLTVWLLQAAYRALQTATVIGLWRRGAWAGVKV